MNNSTNESIKIEYISVDEAKEMKSSRIRESPALERYKRYIYKLNNQTAGMIRIKDNKEGFAVRALLMRAAKNTGITIKIKKVNNCVVFWKE